MRRNVWIVAVMAGLLAGQAAAESNSTSLDDPLLRELHKIAGKRGKNPASQNNVPKNEPSTPLLSEYRIGERHIEILSSPEPDRAIENTPAPPAEGREIRYLSIRDYRPVPATSPARNPEGYLALKRIIDPMPELYAQTYLKLKTLLNPTRKYVQVHIDKSRQRMWVYLDNSYVGDWKVSTARRGYWTPVGTYRPYTLHRMHYSRKYHNSPMPWSVFFKGGYAIHGTDAIRRLGRPASHGCIRVHPQNAKKLYQLIKRYGKQNTRIIIRG
jgi:lipoprotein-anchoring transpeptidase ErfK/SrfK